MGLAEGAKVGAFRLGALLGEGGMGAVWSAVDTRTGERRALKFLKGAATEADQRRFLREARAAMALEHPGIIHVYEVITDEHDLPVIVMELLEGESLSARLHREGRLSLKVFADIFVQVLSAVGTAHAHGIVHRDLKPENIFLASGSSVRVLDFGIAKLVKTEDPALQSAALTATGALMGTPYYMSPEQIYGERDVDHRSDVWSLGVILYECLTGTRPFAGENFGQLIKAITHGDCVPLGERVPGLPADVLEIAERMLAPKAAGRPSDLRDAQSIFRRHTAVEVVDFLAATLPAQVVSERETSSPLQETGGPTAVTAPVIAPKRTVGIVAAIAALVVALVVLRVATRAPEPAIPTATASAPERKADPPASASTIVPPVESIAPVPSVSAAPSASAIAPKPTAGKTVVKTLPSASSAPEIQVPTASASPPPSASAPHGPGLAKNVPF